MCRIVDGVGLAETRSRRVLGGQGGGARQRDEDEAEDEGHVFHTVRGFIRIPVSNASWPDLVVALQWEEGTQRVS